MLEYLKKAEVVSLEVWKPIPGYKGLYEVSNLGRIKSLPGKSRGGGDSEGTKVSKILKNGTYIQTGYEYIILSKDGRRKHHTIHRLVLAGFIGKSKLDCNHINGIKKDNRLENLEYCSKSENQRHAFRIGLQKGGRKQGGIKKLSSVEVNMVRTLHKKGIMKKKDWIELAKTMGGEGVTYSTINNITRGKTYREVSDVRISKKS